MQADAAADARFWDKVARRYAADRIRDMRGYERTLDRTRQLLRKSDIVLELGCGTGTTALALATDVTRILGIDVSGEMIAICREKAAAQAVRNGEFVAMPAEHVAIGAGPFDAVLAFNLLHLVADRAATFAEVHRLLRPGGLLITKTPCLSEMTLLLRLAVPAMRLLGKAPTVSFFTGDGLAEELESAGFTIMERARHGSGRKDPRIFLVAAKPERLTEASDPEDGDQATAPIT